MRLSKTPNQEIEEAYERVLNAQAKEEPKEEKKEDTKEAKIQQ